MGMFDTLIDSDGYEWQTKAFDCTLARYHMGMRVPGQLPTFQVMVFGGKLREGHYGVDSFATVKNGVLKKVPARRDKKLPLFDYSGSLMPQEGDE